MNAATERLLNALANQLTKDGVQFQVEFGPRVVVRTGVASVCQVDLDGVGGSVVAGRQGDSCVECGKVGCCRVRRAFRELGGDGVGCVGDSAKREETNGPKEEGGEEPQVHSESTGGESVSEDREFVGGSGSTGGGQPGRHAGGVGESGESLRPGKTEKNKAKKDRKRKNREARRVEAEKVSDFGVAAASAGSVEVPEWRQKNARAGYHKGAFAECDADVQRKLRNSRAEMLVKKNELAVVRAEADRRKLEATMRSQEIERRVEVDRLRLDEELNKFAASKNTPGFVETIVSGGLSGVFSVPSSGSISPNSSVSVAELHKVEKVINGLVEKINILEGRPKVVKPQSGATIRKAAETGDWRDYFRPEGVGYKESPSNSSVPGAVPGVNFEKVEVEPPWVQEAGGNGFTDRINGETYRQRIKREFLEQEANNRREAEERRKAEKMKQPGFGLSQWD